MCVCLSVFLYVCMPCICVVHCNVATRYESLSQPAAQAISHPRETLAHQENQDQISGVNSEEW